MKIFTYFIGGFIILFSIIVGIAMLCNELIPKNHLIIPLLMIVCGILIIVFQRTEDNT